MAAGYSEENPLSKIGTITTHEADSSPTNKLPIPKEIAARAYEIFLERGATEVRGVEDWLQAEMERAKK
jgi:hypothetical protein